MFFQWALDNGYQVGLSLDRIDSNGNYAPDNCRWIHIDKQKQNTRVRCDNSTGYTGVILDPKSGKYRAYINVDKKRFYLGFFICKHDAATAYNNHVIKHKLLHSLNEIKR